MKKRILVSLVWAIGFPVIGLMVWMIVFCVIGLLGIFQDASQPAARHLYALVVGVYCSSMCASPLIGLALGLWGVLPGTSRPKMSTAV